MPATWESFAISSMASVILTSLVWYFSVLKGVVTRAELEKHIEQNHPTQLVLNEKVLGRIESYTLAWGARIANIERDQGVGYALRSIRSTAPRSRSSRSRISTISATIT